jgi:hypothetical protein
VKFSGLIERVFARESRDRLPRPSPRPSKAGWVTSGSPASRAVRGGAWWSGCFVRSSFEPGSAGPGQAYSWLGVSFLTLLNYSRRWGVVKAPAVGRSPGSVLVRAMKAT